MAPVRLNGAGVEMTAAMQAPYRTTHPDIGIVRVLEEITPDSGKFRTIASFATEAEAFACLVGMRAAAGEDVTAETYQRAFESATGRPFPRRRKVVFAGTDNDPDDCTVYLKVVT